ncbi:MAG: carbon-nitrogen hydrolase family protein [Actinomycetota bacterium]|nr:carbon-nitrogen hydrolase family protein [Actinomycetota bacterium]
MSEIGIAAVAASFGRDVEADLVKIERILEGARAAGADLVVFPEAALGGYLADMRSEDGGEAGLPPALDPKGPELERLALLAGHTVVCAGFCEAGEDGRYNSVACVTGDGLLGLHRKVHLPLGEGGHTCTGTELGAFDTPVGRMGMLICYDKSFPEAARELALNGVEVIACSSAWPASATNAAPRIEDDRQTGLFNLWDQARAAENQVVVASANQVGPFGPLRFLGQAKVVGPGGELLATTGPSEGIAHARVDPRAGSARARRSLDYLRDRRPSAYPLGARDLVGAR